MGAVDVLTSVNVHKSVGYLAVSSGDDSNVTEGALSCNGVMAFLGGFYVRTKLYLTMLVEFQNAASDDAFGSDRAGHPIFICNRVILKYDDE